MKHLRRGLNNPENKLVYFLARMKIILKSYITVLIGMFVLFCFPLSLKGQTQEVRARMIDKAKGQPIPWVYLYVNGKLKLITCRAAKR